MLKDISIHRSGNTRDQQVAYIGNTVTADDFGAFITQTTGTAYSL